MFSRSISDYVVAQDFTNHLQVKIGDKVTVSEAAFIQLNREKHIITTALAGGTLMACTMGLGIGAIGIVGGEIAMGVTAAEMAAIGGVAGGAGSAFLWQKSIDDAKRRATMKVMPFLGKVTRIHQKVFSELHHVEVEFYIPDEDGTYSTKTMWIDAHHLMRLITKKANKKNAKAAEEYAAKMQAEYDAELLKKHRTQFAPENVSLQSDIASLQDELTALKEGNSDLKKQRNGLARLAPFALLLLLI